MERAFLIQLNSTRKNTMLFLNSKFVFKLVFLKNDTKNINATLQLFGYNEEGKPWFISNGVGIVSYPEEAFRADFYVYAICISGKAILKTNNEIIHIEAGTFFTTIPSTILQAISHTKNFKAKVLIFERSFLLKNILDARQLEHLGFFNFNSLAHHFFNEEETKQLSSLFANLYNRSLHSGVFHNEIMQSLILNLLFETAEIYLLHANLKKEKSITREEDLFLKFMKQVQFHFRAQHPLGFYSKSLFISDKYLIQLCKRIAGKTPGIILAEALINEAKLLLNNPENNITMVSQQLNYSSVAAFSKFFKKHTGFAPKDWKNKT